MLNMHHLVLFFLAFLTFVTLHDLPKEQICKYRNNRRIGDYIMLLPSSIMVQVVKITVPISKNIVLTSSTGQVAPRYLDGPFTSFSLVLRDPKISAITIKDAFISQKDRNAVVFTACEVYSRVDVLMNVCAICCACSCGLASLLACPFFLLSPFIGLASQENCQ